jgi:hypothetical protein
VLQCWAGGAATQATQHALAHEPHAIRHAKKKSAGTRPSG